MMDTTLIAKENLPPLLPSTPEHSRQWPKIQLTPLYPTQDSPHARWMIEPKRGGLKLFAAVITSSLKNKPASPSDLAVEVIQVISKIKYVNSAMEKNIRRRVQDAINVMISIGVVDKEEGLIKWIGGTSVDQTTKVVLQCLFPEISRENELELQFENLQNMVQQTKKRLTQKKIDAIQLNQQYSATKWLVDRNIRRLKRPDFVQQAEQSIHIPFVVISSKKDCAIECQMSSERDSIILEYDGPLQMRDDLKLLQSICHNATRNFVEVTNTLPKRKRDQSNSSKLPR